MDWNRFLLPHKCRPENGGNGFKRQKIIIRFNQIHEKDLCPKIWIAHDSQS